MLRAVGDPRRIERAIKRLQGALKGVPSRAVRLTWRGGELRTTIPATIQKARELGDLKENAEYHSAKLKQTNAQKRAGSLQMRISRARAMFAHAFGASYVTESSRSFT